MTEETQALVDRLRDADKLVAQGEVGMALKIASLRNVLQDAAAALSTLSRDLAAEVDKAVELARLVETARGASAADDARLRAAEERVWPGVTHGCDAAEWLADELLALRRDLETARQERDAAERRLTDKAIAHESEMDRANRADAAVRAARAETLRKCALAIREGASAGGAHTTTGYVLLGIADVFDATAAREGQ